MEQAQGRWEAAGSAYRESLDLRRRQLAAVGETPVARAELAWTLRALAAVDEHDGRPDLVAAGRAEADLVERSGGEDDNP